MEDEIATPCPEQGFHGEEQELEDDEDLQQSSADSQLPPPAHVVRLRDAISHTRHLVSMSKRPRWQVIAMDVVATCSAQLAMDK